MATFTIPAVIRPSFTLYSHITDKHLTVDSIVSIIWPEFDVFSDNPAFVKLRSIKADG